MTTYRIVRFFADGRNETRGKPTGLTLEEAKEHCRDPQTSSRTATRPDLERLTGERGTWFDGFEEE